MKVLPFCAVCSKSPMDPVHDVPEDLPEWQWPKGVHRYQNVKLDYTQDKWYHDPFLITITMIGGLAVLVQLLKWVSS